MSQQLHGWGSIIEKKMQEDTGGRETGGMETGGMEIVKAVELYHGAINVHELVDYFLLAICALSAS